uniref:t-SNARE coiled-coil homology domain-containing protein n=1 Tax=Strongyloides venezuelensis TaxID=75913 RepID=A0A0K0G2C8_STRVS
MNSGYSSNMLLSRNLNDVFFLLRSNSKSRLLNNDNSFNDNFSVSFSDDKVALLSNGDLERGNSDESTTPPDWVNMMDEIQYELTRIRTRIDNCQELQNKYMGKHSLVNEEQNTIQQEKINSATSEVSSLLNHCKKLIVLLEESCERDTPTIKILRKNVEAALSQSLSDLIMIFKNNQQKYFNYINSRSNNVSSFLVTPGDDFGNLFEDTVLGDNNQFSEELNVMQIQQIMENETMSKEREKCIMNVSKSIYELNSLFKDLAELVVNQGTILDRIDYNIENTNIRVRSALTNVRKADNYQKKNQKMKIILILSVIVLVLIFLIIITKT